MTILLWTFAPLVALFGAIAWAHWRARPRPVEPRDSVEGYARFCAALEKPLATRVKPEVPVQGGPERRDLVGR